ncbi:MAG: DUF4232 domain-containing protein [Solirubrobacteraceae bacterium]|jgi:hypothetical protein
MRRGLVTVAIAVLALVVGGGIAVIANLRTKTVTRTTTVTVTRTVTRSYPPVVATGNSGTSLPLASSTSTSTIPTGPSGTTATLSGCVSTQLAVVLGFQQGALGHIGQTVSFKNTSTTACTLYGYPGLQMLDASGSPIPTDVLRGIAYTVPAEPEHVVTLAPGGEASFDLGYANSTGFGNATCPASSEVEVTPPNDYTSITVAWKIQPYGGSDIKHLQCGQITVSPVFSGNGAS